MKKIFIVMVMLLTLTSVSAQEVNAGFFDWIKSFFTSEEENSKTNVTQEPINDEVSITLAGNTYTEEEIITTVNSNPTYSSYIQKIGYECFQVELGSTEEFSVRFNLEESTIEDISKMYVCEDTIKIEESLITQIQEEGFNSSKLNQYRKQVDAPFGVYWALGKEYLG